MRKKTDSSPISLNFSQGYTFYKGNIYGVRHKYWLNFGALKRVKVNTHA